MPERTRIFLRSALYGDNRVSDDNAEVFDAVGEIRLMSSGVHIERRNAVDIYPWWRIMKIERRWED